MTSTNPGPAASVTTNTSPALIGGGTSLANLPAATSFALNTVMQTTDAGQVVSNGAVWVPSSQVGTLFPYVANLKRANTDKWRAARGKVQAGIQNARVLCVGNSITAGFDATGVGVTNPSSLAYPTQMAQIMTARGLTSSWQSWIGGQNITNFNTQDNRIVMGSWTNSGLGTFGSNALTLSTTGQTLMSFTPLTQVDTVEVIALRNNGTVAITIAVDGGATLFTYNPGSGSPVIGTSGVRSLGTLGLHAIQANISVATATFLDGMIAWNSAIKEVSVLRAGWQGATVASFNTSPWFYLDGLKAVAPDLTLIAPTRNDVSSATPIATFKSNFQPIINAALISGDVILVIEPLGNLSPALYAPYVQAVYDLATLNNLPVVDFTQLWDTYDNISTWYADTIHPNGFAYGEMARGLAEVLLAL